MIDNSAEGYGSAEMKQRYREISPMHNIRPTAPPTLFVLGTNDPLIPVKTAQQYTAEMEALGRPCELHLIENAAHPIFYYSKPLTPDFYKIRQISDDFVSKYGFINNN